ncbi:putative nuclease HARBI1 [Carcharodon carcharias]|uniref:putative nuclease HARBI1 n=1 Tax=Carcharodon carcharias TaxID=13397 RepID=UPI001B7E9351|nr:putative nuclease HARBI1 [Carcharodon carcharias]
MWAGIIASNCVGGHTMPVELKVSVALNFFASGSFQASAGDLCGMSQAAANHCFKVFIDAIFRSVHEFISFSVDNTSEANRARGYAAIAGFPKVQGIIACTHVAIKAPMGQPGAYVNGKNFHLTNVQLVCNYRQRMIQVCARYHGSCHDSYLLRHSQVSGMFCTPESLDDWLLGDKKRWLMTLVRNLCTEFEKWYNESHTSTRAITERTIGIGMSGMFRRHTAHSPTCVSLMIVVCCTLHNVAIQRGKPYQRRM